MDMVMEPGSRQAHGDGGVTVEELIDFAPWHKAQTFFAALILAAIVCDGFDTLALGVAIPAISAELHVSPSAFGVVFAVGLAGMAIGTFVGGFLGDRWGRRPLLLASIACFGVLTASLSVIDSMPMFIVARLLAGLAMGAAIPNASALLAECTPLRIRALSLSFISLGITSGGILAALVAALMLPSGGWRGLFLVGGACTLGIAGLIWARVPESPKWLALHGVAPDAARRSVEALGIVWPQRVAIVAAVDIPRPARRIGLRNFQGGADIYLMWVVFFCLLTLGYLNVNWIPTVLVKAGFGIKQASFAAAGYNIGGIAGGIVASFFVNRYGSRVLIGVAAVGAAAAFVPAFLMSFHELGYGWLLSIIVFQGICIVAVNAPALAIVAYMHSTSTRATGVALAVGLGRTGAIGSSFLGAEIVHQAHGGPLYFQVVLVLLIVSSIALAMVGRHLKPAPVC